MQALTQHLSRQPGLPSSSISGSTIDDDFSIIWQRVLLEPVHVILHYGKGGKLFQDACARAVAHESPQQLLICMSARSVVITSASTKRWRHLLFESGCKYWAGPYYLTILCIPSIGVQSDYGAGWVPVHCPSGAPPTMLLCRLEQATQHLCWILRGVANHSPMAWGASSAFRVCQSLFERASAAPHRCTRTTWGTAPCSGEL